MKGFRQLFYEEKQISFYTGIDMYQIAFNMSQSGIRINKPVKAGYFELFLKRRRILDLSMRPVEEFILFI
jgi:hypothetical protein